MTPPKPPTRHHAPGVLLALLGLAGLALATPLAPLLASPLTAQQAITEAELAAFQPRHVGPAVTGGRIHDVEALPYDPSTIYVATASGGLWKSVNRGITWTDLWEHMPVSTFGDLAIAPSNPDILYAGTGEQQNRQSTSWGNGVYRSDDAGATWRHLGLDDTHHTGRVQVHPTDPDIVYVAALGNLWRSTPDRGVYRSRDGGDTWDKVLYVDEHTGAIDLAIDPSDPDVLYAAMYQRQRRTWGFNGGGPGSGVYKTTDGGDSWRELTNGLPDGDKGRIGIAVAPTNPRILNILVQHSTESGGYRSEDGGESWEKVSDQNIRPMYYSHVFIDPTNEDRVYTLATSSHRSEDGGRTFVEIAERPTYDVGVHADHHTMWINPADPDHFYLAGDAGLHETYDRGVTFRRINNLPIGQFYGITVDNRDPYWIYGGMQDNHSWMGPSATRSWDGIVDDEWRQSGFGDGMYQQADPDGRTIYINAQNGGWTRFDNRTGDMMSLRLSAPEGEEPYRWDWVSPSLISRHDPNTVYLGGNRLFVSRDRGDSFTRTEDLTRGQDRDELEIMGVRGADITLSRNDGTSSYGEIITISESPHDPAVLWVGTDDGNVQVSVDGARSWNEVSRQRARPPGRHLRQPRARFGAGARHRVRHLRRAPGRRLSPVRVPHGRLRRDLDPAARRPPLRRRRLPGGLDQRDRRASRQPGRALHRHRAPRLRQHRPRHLVGALARPAHHGLRRHGRPPARKGSRAWHARPLDHHHRRRGAARTVRRHRSRRGRAVRERPGPDHELLEGHLVPGPSHLHGRQPVDGTVITYRLGPGSDPARLTVRNAAGEVVRSMAVPSGPGLHRVDWDLRHGLPSEGDDAEWSAHDPAVVPRPLGQRGPFVSPGVYTVELSARGEVRAGNVSVGGDPDLPLTVEDYREREAFLLEILELSGQLEDAGDAASDHRRDLMQLYGAINGGGVRQGTLHPPTATQREQLERIKRALRRQGLVADA